MNSSAGEPPQHTLDPDPENPTPNRQTPTLRRLAMPNYHPGFGADIKRVTHREFLAKYLDKVRLDMIGGSSSKVPRCRNRVKV
jgi:hypothetical protein